MTNSKNQTVKTDLLSMATAAISADRLRAHNGAVLCGVKNCPETANRTVWSISGAMFRTCLNHTAPSYWTIYATAEHGSVYAPVAMRGSSR